MRIDVPQAVKIADIFESAENVKTFVFDLALHSTPGQFVMLWLPRIDEKPFSIARDIDNTFWLTICDVGPFSHALSQKKSGDTVGIRGPFGKGYTLPKNKNVVLIGGGYGMAPLHYCGTIHAQNGCSVTAITGARSAQNVLFEAQCQESGFTTYVTTDDGSAGTKGYVTTVFENLIQNQPIDLVQTCGPEKMMKAVAMMCQEKNIPCEVSVERYMKCGFGVCGQCTVDGSGERMCKEGPVVDGTHALKKFTDFGLYHRGPEGQKVMW